MSANPTLFRTPSTRGLEHMSQSPDYSQYEAQRTFSASPSRRSGAQEIHQKSSPSHFEHLNHILPLEEHSQSPSADADREDHPVILAVNRLYRLANLCTSTQRDANILKDAIDRIKIDYEDEMKHKDEQIRRLRTLVDATTRSERTRFCSATAMLKNRIWALETKEGQIDDLKALVSERNGEMDEHRKYYDCSLKPEIKEAHDQFASKLARDAALLLRDPSRREVRGSTWEEVKENARNTRMRRDAMMAAEPEDVEMGDAGAGDGLDAGAGAGPSALANADADADAALVSTSATTDRGNPKKKTRGRKKGDAKTAEKKNKGGAAGASAGAGTGTSALGGGVVGSRVTKAKTKAGAKGAGKGKGKVAVEKTAASFRARREGAGVWKGM